MAGLFGGGGADSSFSNIKFNPDDLARILTGQNSLTGQSLLARAAAGEARANIKDDFGKFDPRLETNFQPSSTLDAYGQAGVSQGLQQLAQQGQSRQGAISRQFGQGNPGLAGILGFQNKFAGANAGNGLNLAAMTEQRGRQSDVFNMNNAARLAQSQQGSNLQQLGNNAQSTKAQLGQMGFQNGLLELGAQLVAGATKGTSQSLNKDDYYAQNPAARPAQDQGNAANYTWVPGGGVQGGNWVKK